MRFTPPKTSNSQCPPPQRLMGNLGNMCTGDFHTHKIYTKTLTHSEKDFKKSKLKIIHALNFYLEKYWKTVYIKHLSDVKTMKLKYNLVNGVVPLC